MIEGIVGLAAIASGEVKKTIWTENGISGVVVPVRLWNFKEDALVLVVNFARVFFAHASFDKETALRVLQSMVEVELAVFLKLGVKYKAEQTFLEGFLDHIAA